MQRKHLRNDGVELSLAAAGQRVLPLSHETELTSYPFGHRRRRSLRGGDRGGLPGDEDSDDSMALDAAAAATALRSSGGAGSVVGGTGSGSGDGAGTGAGADLSFFSFLPGFSSLAGALNFFSESGTVATGFGAGGEGLLAGTGMSGAGGRVTRGGSTGTATAGSG